MFRSRLNTGERTFSPIGENYQMNYSYVASNGKKELMATDAIDLREKHQAGKDWCDIKNIIKRSIYDPTALNAMPATYGDFTGMPESLAEWQNLAIKAKSEFMKLNPEIRKEFNNSVEEYLNSFGTEKMDKIKEKYAPETGVILEKTTDTKTEKE